MAGSQEIAESQRKELLNKDGKVTELIEWATEGAMSVDEMMDLFLEQGVKVTAGEELTGGYQVIHGEEKVAFLRRVLNEKAFVVQWHFYDGDTGEFVAMHIMIGTGKYILNDSAKGGMYGQLRQVTDRREEQDENAASKRTSTVGLAVPRGIREKDPFYYYLNPDDKNDPQNGKAISKQNLEKVPDKFRKLSNPVFVFNF